MEKQKLITLIEAGKSIRQIATEMKCSFSNVRHWLKKFELNTNPYKENNSLCKICGGALKGTQIRFCSFKCKRESQKSRPWYKMSQERSQKMRDRGLQRKIYFVKRLGGKCKCGYHKNLSALTFHHRDPNNKAFNLDLRNMAFTRMEILEKEVEKCDLLCQNCHVEKHYPKYNDWKNGAP